MSAETPNWNPNVSAQGLKIAIIAARFNEQITSALLQGAQQALKDAQADVADVYYVPGAFELPFAAKKLSGRYHAIVALGAVVRGDTPHFEYVSGECARGIQQVMLETGIPVIFGVLTTNTWEQAQDRAGGKHGNKGYDAAMTAVEMAQFGK